MSIRKGNTILAGSTIGTIDNVTITENSSDALTVIGTLNKNDNTPKYDWIGTKAEYNALGTYNDNWLYYITDDMAEVTSLANCVGQLVQAFCTADYIPNGCIPCDGQEYSASRFQALWDNYLACTTPKLLTCTYNEYATSISTYGQCAKFAVNKVNNTFKAPTIKDGAFVQQAKSTLELGKSYNAGLPNITGHFRTTQWADTNLGAFYRNNTGGNFLAQGSDYPDVDIAFNASRSSTVYGKSSTVQPDAVALRYFIVVVDSYLNQSQLDWTAYQTALNTKADLDLANTNRITNCITHIPQNINLELNEGILTLKVGSKVYIPNGFEEDGTTPKFDTIIIPNNITYPLSHTTVEKRLVSVVESDTIALTGWSYVNVNSGTTNPGLGQVWYDTATNLIKLSSDGGSTWTATRLSLPVCFGKYTNGFGFNSLNQAFNGFGYIGSTVFALPGIEGLLAAGRNEDGTLKSNKIILNSVITNTLSGTTTGQLTFWLNNEGEIHRQHSRLFNYDEINNSFSSNGVNFDNALVCGTYEVSSSKITSMSSHTSFHALDYNDKNNVIKWGIPDYTAGISIASGYTASMPGIFMFGSNTYSSNPTFSVNGSVIYTSQGFGSERMCNNVFILLKAGDVISWSQANATTATAVFYPLIGGK